jgi:hypothetical protein
MNKQTRGVGIREQALSSWAIQERIKAREFFETCMGLMPEDCSMQFKVAFAKQCRFFADSILGEPLQTMNSEDAAKYEQNQLGFGKYSDLKIIDVPIAYLTWVSDQNLTLAAYLRSNRGQERVSKDA